MVTSKVAGFLEPFFLLDDFFPLDEPLPPSANTAADSSSAPSSSAPTRLGGRILVEAAPPPRSPSSSYGISAVLTAPDRPRALRSRPSADVVRQRMSNVPPAGRPAASRHEAATRDPRIVL